MPTERPIPAPLLLHEERVRGEWLDYNDHMNVAYYTMVFDHASEAFVEYLGMGAEYTRATRGSWVVLEAHATFSRELRGDDPLRVATRVLGYDAKRVHLFHTLYHAGDGYQAATSELMLMHVDLDARRASRFPPAVIDRVREVARAHAGLVRPPELGRVIGLPPPRGAQAPGRPRR
jgi:acyl-CoA thioester hydrolase